MKRLWFLLLASIILSLAGCLPGSMAEPAALYPAPPTATGPYPMEATRQADLEPYYGRPPAARIVVDGQSQTAGVGSTTWIERRTLSETVSYHGDAFGIMAPSVLITVSASFTVTLELPLEIPPTELTYVLYQVEEADLWGYGKFKRGVHEYEIWNPTDEPRRGLPSHNRLAIPFVDMPESLYILLVEAGWEELGSTDYGFLLFVENRRDPKGG